MSCENLNSTTGKHYLRLSGKCVVIVVPALAEGQDPDLSWKALATSLTASSKLGHVRMRAVTGLDSTRLTRTQSTASQLFIERSPGLNQGLGGRGSDFA